MSWLIYNLIFAVGFVLALPYYLFRMVRRGGYARGFEQRLGFYSAGIQRRLEGSPRVWVHSVSVGELFVALSFIKEYRAAFPEQNFVLTVNTSTAHRLAEDRLDARDVLLYFPVDFPWVVRRVLDRIRPAKLVLVECEIWPNLLRQAHQRGTGLYLINGRLSDRSYRGYLRLHRFARPVMVLFDAVCVQGERDAQRFIAIGARSARVWVTGSAKYEGALALRSDAEAARVLLRRAGVEEGCLILTGGSTWPGEEELLLKVYAELREAIPGLFLVLVPRHFERAPEVLKMIEARGLRAIRRSALLESEPSQRPDLLLVDTTGELMNFYAVSDAVFVGKSFPPNRGGQNPIEPAACGRAVVVGPHMENFPSVMEDFIQAQALVQVRDKAELTVVLRRWLTDAAVRSAQGRRAAERVCSKTGVLARTVERVVAVGPVEAQGSGGAEGESEKR